MLCYGDLLEILLSYGCFVPTKITNCIWKPKKSCWRCTKKGNNSSYVKSHIFWILFFKVHCFVFLSHAVFLWVILFSGLEFSGQFLFGTGTCLALVCLRSALQRNFVRVVWPETVTLKWFIFIRKKNTLWISLLLFQVCWQCDSLTSSAGSWT